MPLLLDVDGENERVRGTSARKRNHGIGYAKRRTAVAARSAIAAASAALHDNDGPQNQHDKGSESAELTSTRAQQQKTDAKNPSEYTWLTNRPVVAIVVLTCGNRHRGRLRGQSDRCGEISLVDCLETQWYSPSRWR